MKALFIDFDGTLCDERYWRSLPPKEHKAVQELLFKNNTQIVHDWMRGGYTAEEVNKYVAETLGIPYQELWDLFVLDCQTMQVSKLALEMINSLRKKFTVVLMTGNMDSFSRFTAPVLNLNNYFDLISVSYEEGKHKTDNDGELFLEYADKLKIDIDDWGLIDDNQKCCDIFSTLGGKAFKVSSVEETETVLRDLLG